MIDYQQGQYHLQFIFSLRGSVLPQAACYALPSTLLALLFQYLLQHYGDNDHLRQLAPSSTLVWTISFFTLGMLITFRCDKAYKRFWDGCEFVQAMSAEWFESCSNLIAFSSIPLKQKPNDQETERKVRDFQFRLVHLMSLLHGVALRQIGQGNGENGEEISILDVFGIDDSSLEYLTHACEELEINRAEVILHWIQVLITESMYDGVLVIPAPILTRSYQTLSRGMVNLHHVRRIADIPFPFPLSQAIVILLLMHCILTPIMVSFFFASYLWGGMVTFLPIFGSWAIVFVCGEIEQPFGRDANDLPLAMQQFDFHTSLMMLVDKRSMIVPVLKEDAACTVDELRARFGMPDSNTSVLHGAKNQTMRQMLRTSPEVPREGLVLSASTLWDDDPMTAVMRAQLSLGREKSSGSVAGSPLPRPVGSPCFISRVSEQSSSDDQSPAPVITTDSEVDVVHIDDYFTEHRHANLVLDRCPAARGTLSEQGALEALGSKATSVGSPAEASAGSQGPAAEDSVLWSTRQARPMMEAAPAASPRSPSFPSGRGGSEASSPPHPGGTASPDVDPRGLGPAPPPCGAGTRVHRGPLDFVMATAAEGYVQPHADGCQRAAWGHPYAARELGRPSYEPAATRNLSALLAFADAERSEAPSGAPRRALYPPRRN